MNPNHGEDDLSKPSTTRTLISEFARYLIMGTVNTIVAYAIYLFLLQWMRYEFAYTIGYTVGVLLAYGLSTAFVFRTPMRKRSAMRFPIVYVAQFLVSLVLLRLAVEVIHLPQWMALGFAVILTIPVTFLLSRWVLRSG